MDDLQRKAAEVQLEVLKLQHKLLESRLKGDTPGHPFRGNQYAGGGSSDQTKLPPPSKPTDKNGVVRVQQSATMTNVADLTGKGLSNNDARWAFSQAKAGDDIEYKPMEVGKYGGYDVGGKVTKVAKTASGNYNIYVDQIANRGQVVLSSKTPVSQITLTRNPGFWSTIGSR